MGDEQLLVHLQRSLEDSANAGRDFALAAERICRSTLQRFAGGLAARRGLLDDAVQEALMRVWAKRRTCRGHSAGEVAGWIAAIARCTAIDLLRSDGPERCELGGITFLSEPEHEDSTVQWDAARNLTELAWSLGHDANEVLWLRLVCGDSWQSIGSELGVSWTAARRRYQRAVTRLRILAVAGPKGPVTRALELRVPNRDLDLPKRRGA